MPWKRQLKTTGNKGIMRKLAIITTHPIQYYAPVFKWISQSKRVDLRVYYTLGKGNADFDPGFGKEIKWDIPLLEGYSYEFLENVSKQPGLNHFYGIVNPEAKKKISQFNPDAILIYGWNYQSHFQILRYFKNKIPVFFRGDSTLLDNQSILKKLLRKQALKWIFSYTDYAFYVGYANKEYFEWAGLKNKQLFFAPHAIDNGRFSLPRSCEAVSLRTELGVKPGEALILFAGKLEPKKNPMLLLKAFEKACLQCSHLLIVGNGVLEEELKTTATHSKLAGNIHFMDFQNQTLMPAIYQASDLFCLPSSGPGETWGLAVNEAMATGLAVLVSDKVGCALDLVDNQNGYVFPSGNLEELVSALEKLVKSGRLKEMGDLSFQKIKNYSFEIQAENIINNLPGGN
jgi:glycosyltransferase involved in cell wall biosynthesis